MSQIRILSEHLANQIAAGEVVERPASVVKELLENSLDAGAKRVDVQVERGGTGLLRVVDDGQGMDEDDVLLCLERHATSKLTTEEQLAAIATLGFRGEALPSIGSVSRMTILSRTPEAPTGTRADIRYGTLHSVHEDGCSRGTLIEVRHLFGNMPARKKFLKTTRIELAHIYEVVCHQSLAHPRVAFSLQVEGRKVLDYSASDFEQRVRDVFKYTDTLLPVEAVDEQDGGPQINGFLLLPDVASGRLRLLVNARPVQDRMVRHAVTEGLQGFLMKGHQPAGALHIGLSPELVDVNVHPAKREIRFRNSRHVHRFVVSAVAEAIKNHQENIRSKLFAMPEQPMENSGVGSTPVVPPPVQSSVFQQTTTRRGNQEEAQVMQTREPFEENIALEPPALVPEEEAGDDRQQPKGKGLHLIGQFLNLYLLCERDGELVVIDQHAAHERILFQKMRLAFQQQQVPRQTLLFPETVELGPDHAETMEKEAATVAALGLEVEFFGDCTWVVKAVPSLASGLSGQEILIDTLDGLQGKTTGDDLDVVPPFIDNLLASMACKAAIKAGNRLQAPEMIDLLEQMEQSDVFSHCPHGRPVIKTFSAQEIEQWFHRT